VQASSLYLSSVLPSPLPCFLASLLQQLKQPAFSFHTPRLPSPEMPQAARKDVAAQRAQDKESKRARGAMSCAECRRWVFSSTLSQSIHPILCFARLKLKCDKTVPCSSCKRRGCAQICMNPLSTTTHSPTHSFSFRPKWSVPSLHFGSTVQTNAFSLL